MNLKVSNFTEINKKEWLASSTTEAMDWSVHGC